jgi:hypothetical protein
MRIKMLLAAGLLGWCAVAAAETPPPFVGTWNLDLARSRYDSGPPPRSHTEKNEAVDGGQRQIADRVDAEGRARHTEYTARFDGKDYPVTGNPNADTIWLRKVDDRTVDWGMKKGDKLVLSGRTVYSSDGKTRTMTYSGTDSKGQKVNNTTVWTKQ